MKAARERFLTAGVDGASLREIAADARTSVGMVSYYFRSKDELLFAVLERVYPRFLSELATHLEQPGTVEQRLARLFARLHRMDDEEFAVLRILLREAMVSSTRLKKLIARFSGHGGHVPMILLAMGQGMSAGEIRDDLPPVLLMVSTMALAMAPVIARRLATSAGFGQAFPQPEEAAAALARVLFEGIGAPKRGARRRQVKRSLR